MSLLAEIGGPEGDLLGLTRVQGAGFAGEDRARPLLELTTRLRGPERLGEELRSRRTAGWRGMVVLGEPRLSRVLATAPREAIPRPLPIVPNLQGFMREAVEYGMVGAGMRRALRVGPLGLAGLGLRSVPRLPLLWRRDFATMLRSFIELELAEFARRDPPVVFLQAQMTDLALAMDQPRILEAFLQATRRRTGAAPGLMTYNLAPLVAKLEAWGFAAEALLAPWSASPARLRPDAAACAAAARRFPGLIWGLGRNWIDAPSPEARAALAAAGLAGAVRDDAAAWADRPAREVAA